MPPKPKLNVHSFPRPPLLEKTSRHLLVKWADGTVIAETREGYWVLETTHPPTYYLPPTSLQTPTTLTQSTKRTLCEWKGAAIYWNITPPTTPTTSPTPTSTPISSTTSLPKQVTNRIWSYESPTKPFAPIKGYLSFYAGPWDCFVDGEKVAAQPGDFYGGWVTSEIEGRVKGGPGTWGW
ncbi:Protein of unknown function DUF427 [Lasallia pustulata]|uniref:DUF427 domain-containing protein n=1 Tax=Lasallia pustulata TaxID=136370 RepID=A0A1W5D9E2_9LECA|nr:Protein of unknown function DUF427 [Lasallia pustulata]